MKPPSCSEIRKLGYKPHIMRGVARTVIGAIGDELTHQSLESLPSSFPHAVESVMPVQKRYKLVSREAHPANSSVNVRGNLIGGKKFQVMAGPCSVESEKQLLATAARRQKSRAPPSSAAARSNPARRRTNSRASASKGLKLLDKARRETGLAIITELLSERRTRSWWPNSRTSSRSARATRRISNCSSPPPRPASRSCSSAASPCASRNGCWPANTSSPTTTRTCMFCERGIRTFETYTRNTLDLSTIPIIKKESHCADRD